MSDAVHRRQNGAVSKDKGQGSCGESTHLLDIAQLHAPLACMVRRKKTDKEEMDKKRDDNVTIPIL